MCTAKDKVVTITGDEDVHIWDLQTQDARKVDIVKGQQVVSVAISPSERYLSIVYEDKILLLNIESEQPELVESLKGREEGANVSCMAFSVDESLVAIGFKDGKIHVWKIDETKSWLWTEFEGLETDGEVAHLAFSPDLKQLSCLFSHGGIRSWELRNNTDNWGIELGYSVFGDWQLSFHPKHNWISFVEQGQNQVSIWDIVQSRQVLGMPLVESVKDLESSIKCADFSATGLLAILVTGINALNREMVKRSIHVGNIEEQKELTEMRRIDLDKVGNQLLCWSPDGQYLTVPNASGIALWEVQTQQLFQLDCQNSAKDMVGIYFDPQTKWLACVLENGSIFYWDFVEITQALTNGEVPSPQKLNVQDIASSQIVLYGDKVYYACDKDKLKAFDLAKKKEEDIGICEEARNSRGFIFVAKGKILMINNSDTIDFFDIQQKRVIFSLEHKGLEGLAGIAIAPSGRYLAFLPSDHKASIQLVYLDLLLDYLQSGRQSPNFQQLYERSFQTLPYEMVDIKLEETNNRPLTMNPINGFTFENRDSVKALEQSRPLGKDPLKWLMQKNG